MLKKEYGIRKFKEEYGKRISQILRKNSLYVCPDKKNLSNQIEKLKKHLNKHKKDHSTRRIMLIQEAKLRKLEKIGY
jgi:ribosomal protein S15P/S13E